MLTRKPKQQLCVLMSRALSERKKSRAPPKPYKDRNPRFQPKVPFTWEENHRHGPTWDKTLTVMETHTLAYFDNHQHKVEDPYVVRERVHDVSEVLPGVKIGPEFWDNYAGDTQTQGNEEAAVISNFLHLTPPMIRAHTDELRNLCTPPPTKPEEAQGIRHYTTNYVFPGSSVRHPLSREVSLRVSLSSLDLTEEEKGFVREMVDTMKMPSLKEIRHYEEWRLPKILRDLPVVVELKDDQLTIHSGQCPTRTQNLGLCYYRLSGFIREAKSLNPVIRDFHIPRIHLKFLFEENEELIERFQEKHYVKFIFDETNVSQLEGSEEAIEKVKRIIDDVTHDLVVKPVKLPSEYRDYLLEHSVKFRELLEEYEANYIEDSLVAYSDSLANVEEGITTLIESLAIWQVHCPARLQSLALDTNMRKNLMTDFNVLVMDKSSSDTDADADVDADDDADADADADVDSDADSVTVIGHVECQEGFNGAVESKIAALMKDLKVEELPCSQSDINWPRMAEKFGVHIEFCDEAKTIRLTGEIDKVVEFKSFLMRREANERERRELEVK